MARYKLQAFVMALLCLYCIHAAPAGTDPEETADENTAIGSDVVDELIKGLVTIEAEADALRADLKIAQSELEDTKQDIQLAKDAFEASFNVLKVLDPSITEVPAEEDIPEESPAIIDGRSWDDVQLESRDWLPGPETAAADDGSVDREDRSIIGTIIGLGAAAILRPKLRPKILGPVTPAVCLTRHVVCTVWQNYKKAGSSLPPQAKCIAKSMVCAKWISR